MGKASRPPRPFEPWPIDSCCLRAGGANQGHYHAIIKDLYGQGVWEAAVAAAQEGGASSAFGGGAAVGGGAKSAWGKMGAKLAGVADDVGGAEYVVEDYVERPELLIRDLVTQYEAMNGNPSGTGLYLKQLETEIAEQTGVAWNTRYKALHGTLREFVESKPHLFDVRDSLVSVVEGAAWPDQAQGRSAQQAPARPLAHAPASGPPQSAWGSADAGGGRPSSWAKIAGKSAAPLECTEKCWFDFNDMNITPVPAKEIDKYCEGQESAYVLFYRRKSHGQQDDVAPKASVPHLPAHMKEEIDVFNATVQNSRLQHAEKMSYASVKCFAASSLAFDGVALRPSPYGRHFNITIDRRQSLAQTKRAIYNKLLQEHSMSKGAFGTQEVQAGEAAVKLHLLRRCVAPSAPGAHDGALHAYELVGPDHEDGAPLGTRVKDGMEILVWDGSGAAVGWTDFRVGPEAEALALTISYLKPSLAQRDSPPAARSPGTEAKGVWGNSGVSAAAVVSGVGAGDDEDGPPPEGERMLARKDWTLAYLRRKLGDGLRRFCAAAGHDVSAESAAIMMHRLDRAQTLGGHHPKVLDATDDGKPLGDLDLKTANGCWLGVEFAPTAVWQDIRAHKAFKWTNGGQTRVMVELPVPDSSTVLTTSLDVEWDILLQDLKKKAKQQLTGQIRALPQAQMTAIAGTNDGKKKELRLVFLGSSWGEQGFVAVDETASLREMFQPNTVLDMSDESELPQLPVTVKARIVPVVPMVANPIKPELAGPVEVRVSLVSDGVRGPAISVCLQREMLLPQCRQQLASALRIEHRANDHRMRATNWADDPADEIEEDASTCLGAAMHALNLKAKSLILLEPGAPHSRVPPGHVRINVWQHLPHKRSTLLAECGALQFTDRPDGQVTPQSSQPSFESLQCCDVGRAPASHLASSASSRVRSYFSRRHSPAPHPTLPKQIFCARGGAIACDHVRMRLFDVYSSKCKSGILTRA